MTQTLLKADEVAKLLNVQVARIYELTRQNLIPHIKIGERQYRYSKTALMNWIESGGSKTETNTKDI